MLNQLELVTLNAFFTALLELDSPLPAELQQEINKVGEMWKKSPNTAVNRLLELAENEPIKKLYWQARLHIQKQYEDNERNKFDKPDKQNQPTATPPERLENIALPILQADDSPAAAKEQKSVIMLITQNP